MIRFLKNDSVEEQKENLSLHMETGFQEELEFVGY